MLSRQLVDWFSQNQRDLPWRKTRDPYAIWISEVMLQQTTSKAVIPYFQKFLDAFPRVQDLARAREEKVLSLWSGLGYYSRARNLHKASKQIVSLGNFPSRYIDLIQLQGIGPYTAAAVASLAFGEEVAVVDGNVVRVVTRLFDISKNVSLKETQDRIRKECSTWVREQNPRDLNQAMMELGATVCTPKSPSCLICPVYDACMSRKAGTQSLRPVKIKKLKQEPWEWRLDIALKNKKIGFVKSENGTPWLKNSWVFPGRAKALKTKPKSWDFKHSITKHEIFVTLNCVKNVATDVRWVEPRAVSKLGVSSVVTKALKTDKFKKFLEEN